MSKNKMLYSSKMKSLPKNWEESQYKGVKLIKVQIVKHDKLFPKGSIRFVSKEEYDRLLKEVKE